MNKRLIHSKNPLLDWPTDSEENGNYEGECCSCKQSYIGPKHSFHCWFCKTESEERWNKLTPEEKKKEEDELVEKFTKWWEKSKNETRKE